VRKIKIASVRACRMRRFALNIAQKHLVAGLRLDPLGELTALLQTRGGKEKGVGQGRKAGKRGKRK